MPATLSSEVLQNVIAMQRDGHRLVDLAASLGVTRRVLSKAMRSLGYKPGVPSPVMLRLGKDTGAIITAYLAGHTITDLTRQYTCDQFSLKKFLIKNGVSLRKEWVRNRTNTYSLEASPEFIKTIVAEYEAGANITSIAASHRHSPAYIRKLLKRAGTQLRQTGPVKSSEDKALANTLKQYGVSVEQFNDMNMKQAGKCAICGATANSVRNGKNDRLCVDHAHGTGDVRGLLCSQCNMALGNFADNVVWLENAINYIKQTPVFKAGELTTTVNTKYMAIDKSVEERIVHLLKQDMRYIDISKEVGVSPTTVRSVAKRSGLDKPRAIVSLETKHAIAADRELGMSASELARKYKLTVSSIYKVLAGQGK